MGDVQIGEDPDLPHANTVEPPDEPLAITSDGRKHLDQLVDQALLPLLGQVPDRDDDGDIPVVSGTAVVFVRTGPHAPLITIWAEVAVEVSDLDRAKFEVEVLNRDRPFAKFVLVDDRIVAQVHLPAAPFAPEHLRQTLAMMCELADEVDDDLAVRVSGRRFLEPDDVQETDAGDDSESDGNPPGDAHASPARRREPRIRQARSRGSGLRKRPRALAHSHPLERGAGDRLAHGP